MRGQLGLVLCYDGVSHRHFFNISLLYSDNEGGGWRMPCPDNLYGRGKTGLIRGTVAVERPQPLKDGLRRAVRREAARELPNARPFRIDDQYHCRGTSLGIDPPFGHS